MIIILLIHLSLSLPLSYSSILYLPFSTLILLSSSSSPFSTPINCSLTQESSYYILFISILINISPLSHQILTLSLLSSLSKTYSVVLSYCIINIYLYTTPILLICFWGSSPRLYY